MNSSTINQTTYKKAMSLTSCGDDIIFLSDLRLNSSSQKSSSHDVTKIFQGLGYNLMYHSTKSSRGVGILIKLSLDHVIHTVTTDWEDDNFMLLDVTINSLRLTIGSVYGPNTDDDLDFYNRLNRGLRELTNKTIIIGGDWNATWDTSRVENNIDILNMADIPSINRSTALHQMATAFNLIDPFRLFYPLRREFTFVPTSAQQTNRSRLDFFLISSNLSAQCTNCTIPHTTLSTDFDHKKIRLLFRKTKKHTNTIIKDHALDSAITQAYIRTSLYDCYLQHANISQNLTVGRKEELLAQVGHILLQLSEIREIELDTATNGPTAQSEMDLAGRLTGVQIALEELPNLNFFETLELNCNPCTFFEVLVMNIKNSALAHQAHFYKIKKQKVESMSKVLSELKRNYQTNSREILIIERNLALTIENELKTELKHMRKFEKLNNEKITPYFMSIVKKSSQSEKSLRDVKNDNGEDFLSSKDQDGYILGFYKTLYKRSAGPPPVIECIENFLGEIQNNEVVTNSKLTLEEKTDLDRDLDIGELDKSVNEANLGSAPGLNGISNTFIKKFWDLFRVPLFRYSLHALENGELTDSFKLAKIKLIPKKGDCTKIKNWRPISLLNCFYKILSRLVTSRIRKYIDKLTPIGQRGYSKTRYCQEVLVNIYDEVQQCKKNNKNGALVSLDIKKAFDSLGNSFVVRVLEFFNFGPKMIGWLKTICFGRKACILLNNDTISDIFDLERGNAQGDNISPFIFILCYQILLFRLEFDNAIEGIVVPADPPEPPVNPPAQVKHFSVKVFAYADDATCLLLFTRETLIALRLALDEFAHISGLECNVEKTVLVQVGLKTPPTQEIIDLGFSIQTKVTILGSVIDSDTGNFDANIKKTEEKVKNLVRFWSRFNLSLPGRILIAKTMMLSQVNYLGCILPYTAEQLGNVEKAIGNYVKGYLRLAENRLYDETANGGLGLFKLSTFLKAQKCSWIMRAQNIDDLWKARILSRCYGPLLNIRAKEYDSINEPIIYGIVCAWEDFYFKFCATNENYKVGFIFDNPVYRTGRGLKINRDFFGRDFFDENRHLINRLNYADLFNQQN